MPRCDGCSNRRCSCVLTDGDNTEVLGTGSPTDPYRINAAGGDGASLWESGDIKPTGRAVASAGWLLCDGSAVSRATYADLFAAIGTVYGVGDGTSTFNVPDLAGAFPFGFDGAYPLGSTGGQEQNTLTVGNLPAHAHTIAHSHSIAHDHANVATDSQGAHTHTQPAHQHGVKQSNDDGTNNNTFRRGSQQDREVDTTAAGDDATGSNGAHTHNVNLPAFSGNSGASSAVNSGSVGSGQAFTNMPPFTAINYVIKS